MTKSWRAPCYKACLCRQNFSLLYRNKFDLLSQLITSWKTFCLTIGPALAGKFCQTWIYSFLILPVWRLRSFSSKLYMFSNRIWETFISVSAFPSTITNGLIKLFFIAFSSKYQTEIRLLSFWIKHFENSKHFPCQLYFSRVLIIIK